ncbi:hypothetical protein GF385_00245 [Candidatus Dependentiae bacterium]|nr:hypothetical protein [Candidatus Dependentiae bacterium]
MNFCKKIIPLIFGAFFLTVNAYLPNEVTVKNLTDENIFVCCSFKGSRASGGYNIIKEGVETFPASYDYKFNSYHKPNCLYIYVDWQKMKYDFRENKYKKSNDKIKLNYAILFNKKRIILDNFAILPTFDEKNKILVIEILDK